MAAVKKTKTKTKKKKEKKEKTAFEKLSDKHRLFVINYVANLYNGTRAYMATYPKAKYNTARTKAAVLVAKGSIKQAVQEISDKQFADIMTDLEKNITYQLIKAIGDATIDNVVDLKGGTLKVKDLEEIPVEAIHAIQAIEQDEKETGQGGYSKNLKVKMHSKLQALKIRAEIQKLIDPKAEAQPLEITIIPAQRPDRSEDD